MGCSAGLFIDLGEPAVEFGDVDSVGGLFEEDAESLFALAEGLVGILSFGDVADDGEDVDAGGELDAVETDFGVKEGAVEFLVLPLEELRFSVEGVEYYGGIGVL